MALVQLGNVARTIDVIEKSGYGSSAFYDGDTNFIHVTERIGWTIQPFRGWLAITERGKIALAVEHGLRHKRKYRISTGEFLRRVAKIK